MRRRTVLWAATVLFSATAVACAAAPRDAAPPERKALEAIYDRYERLVKRDDKEGLVRFYQETTTAEYVGKLVGGKTITRDETITELMAGPTAYTQLKDAEIRITKVTLKGGEAIVDYTQRLMIHIPGPQGKPRKLDTQGTQRDTWVRQGTVWRCRLGEVLSQKALLDGKPLKINPQ